MVLEAFCLFVSSLVLNFSFFPLLLSFFFYFPSLIIFLFSSLPSFLRDVFILLSFLFTPFRFLSLFTSFLFLFFSISSFTRSFLHVYTQLLRYYTSQCRSKCPVYMQLWECIFLCTMHFEMHVSYMHSMCMFMHYSFPQHYFVLQCFTKKRQSIILSQDNPAYYQHCSGNQLFLFPKIPAKAINFESLHLQGCL